MAADDVGKWWFLIETDSDNSLSVIAEANILSNQTAALEVQDTVAYVYKGKPFEGTVIAKDRYFDVINAKLLEAAAAAKKTKPNVKIEKEPTPRSGRTRGDRGTREIQPVPPKASLKKGKPSPEDKKNARDEASEKKKKAQQLANESLLKQVVVPTKDYHDSSSDSEVDVKKHSTSAVKTNQGLMANLKRALDDADDNVVVDVNVEPEVDSEEMAIEEKISHLKKKLKTIKDKKTAKQPEGTYEATSAGLEDADKKELSDDDGKKSDLTDFNVSAENSDQLNNGDGENQDADDISVDEADLETTDLNYQLYGQSKDTKELAYGIYCNQQVLHDALKASSAVSHFVRRVFVGVFKPSQVMDCTPSGQSWNAGGPELKNKAMKQLHPQALKAIVGYANAVAKKKGCKCRTYKSLRPTISGRLNEVKTQFGKGLLKDFTP